LKLEVRSKRKLKLEKKEVVIL